MKIALITPIPIRVRQLRNKIFTFAFSFYLF